MKYIFTIHSHITFLAALATIQYEKLERRNVVIVCNNYAIPFKVEAIKVVSSLSEKEKHNSIFMRLLEFNYGKKADRFIKEISGGTEYIAFIDLMSDFNRFLTTNLQCQGFNFIEEGIVNYGDFDSFRMLSMDLDKSSWRLSFKRNFKEILNAQIRILRGRSLKILNLPIHPNAYAFFKGVKFYGFSDFSFPNIPKSKKRKVSLMKIGEIDTMEFDQKYFLNDSYIWIGDSMCSHYDIAMSDYESAVKKVVAGLNEQKEVRKVYIKYRGRESQLEKNITESALKSSNFEIHYLPKDMIMELLFLKSTNLKVIGNGSSLLIYAKLANHKVYSVFPYIPNKYNIPLANDYDGVSKLLEF